MEILTDFPERLRAGVQVYVGDAHQPCMIHRRRMKDEALLLAFDGYTTPEAVGELRNQLVYVQVADRPPLPAGEYYHHQVLGCRVVTEDGRVLGTLQDILSTGANDVYVVRPETGPEILLPVIKSVVLAVDLEKRQIKVNLLPGLLAD